MSSASRKLPDDCTRFSASIAAYVDGELDPAHAVDMEAHVVACGTCAERVALIRAMRVSLKRVATRTCPAALRARIAAAVAHERQSERGPASGDPRGPRVIKLRYAVALAAAAGVAFATGMSSLSRAHNDDMVAETPATTRANTPFGLDAMLDELLALHAHPFRPDTMDPDELDDFDRFVGVRVRRPAFQPLNPRFQGARVHPVSDRGAYLQLQYSVGDSDGNRFTVYIFNPRVVPMRGKRLKPRYVRQRPVFVGHVRGYSVAALEEGGVGYAIASDTDESTRMVLSAVAQ
jgi:hypothetical protein